MKKRRSKKDCQFYNEYDSFITCDNHQVKVRLCTKICKFFIQYKPVDENDGLLESLIEILANCEDIGTR